MRPNQKIPCHQCGRPMDRRAQHGCRACRGTGPKITSDGSYARSIGITTSKLRALGGEAKLRSLSPEVLAILLAPTRYGNSRTVHNGGLLARGMRQRVPGILTTRPEMFREKAD